MVPRSSSSNSSSRSSRSCRSSSSSSSRSSRSRSRSRSRSMTSSSSSPLKQQQHEKKTVKKTVRNGDNNDKNTSGQAKQTNVVVIAFSSRKTIKTRKEKNDENMETTFFTATKHTGNGNWKLIRWGIFTCRSTPNRSSNRNNRRSTTERVAYRRLSPEEIPLGRQARTTPQREVPTDANRKISACKRGQEARAFAPPPVLNRAFRGTQLLRRKNNLPPQISQSKVKR